MSPPAHTIPAHTNPHAALWPFPSSPVEVRLSFQLSSNLLSPQYTITCTSTGGTVLTSSFTGPGGESFAQLAAVGESRARGQDTYRSSVTKNNGSHGDTFHCMASNGASTDTKTYTLSGKHQQTFLCMLHVFIWFFLELYSITICDSGTHSV